MAAPCNERVSDRQIETLRNPTRIRIRAAITEITQLFAARVLSGLLERMTWAFAPRPPQTRYYLFDRGPARPPAAPSNKHITFTHTLLGNNSANHGPDLCAGFDQHFPN